MLMLVGLLHSIKFRENWFDCGETKENCECLYHKLENYKLYYLTVNSHQHFEILKEKENEILYYICKEAQMSANFFNNKVHLS